MKKTAFLIFNIIFLTAVISGCARRSDESAVSNVDSAIALIESGDYGAAASSLKAAEAAGENLRRVYRTEGLMYMQQGLYEEASESFIKALGESRGIPDKMDYDMNYYLGDCYMRTERYAEAEEVYSSVIAMRKKDKRALYFRGLSRLKAGKTAEASEDFEAAVEADPTDYDNVIMIYAALAENGREAEGKAFLSAAADSAGDRLSNYDKGRFAYYMGDYPSAQKYLEQARSSGGSNVLDAVLLLGRAAEEQQDYDYAQGVYRSYLKNQQPNARVYNLLGLCEIKTGQYDAAISDFESGLSLDDAAMRRELSWNIIVAYEYKGEFGTANDLIKAYLTSYPADEKAKREAVFLSTRGGSGTPVSDITDAAEDENTQEP